MRFSILGSIQVESQHGVVEVSGAFQSALLGALLVGEGRLVQTEMLFAELWREEPPRNAANALHAHVSRLRRKLDRLEPERTDSRLLRHQSGYRLLIDESELDASRLLRTLAEVRAGTCAEPEHTARRLREALALWRGPVFGGVVTGPIGQSAVIRYEEARTVALALLYEAELALGRHVEILAELVELVESEAFNEHFCQQLMVALYRAGRQTDALAMYRRMRARLAEELGIVPSPALQRCERAILEQDPALELGGAQQLGGAQRIGRGVLHHAGRV